MTSFPFHSDKLLLLHSLALVSDIQADSACKLLSVSREARNSSRVIDREEGLPGIPLTIKRRILVAPL